jgi:hypothetical protein
VNCDWNSHGGGGKWLWGGGMLFTPMNTISAGWLGGGPGEEWRRETIGSWSPLREVDPECRSGVSADARVKVRHTESRLCLRGFCENLFPQEPAAKQSRTKDEPGPLLTGGKGLA